MSKKQVADNVDLSKLPVAGSFPVGLSYAEHKIKTALKNRKDGLDKYKAECERLKLSRRQRRARNLSVADKRETFAEHECKIKYKSLREENPELQKMEREYGYERHAHKLYTDHFGEKVPSVGETLEFELSRQYDNTCVLPKDQQSTQFFVRCLQIYDLLDQAKQLFKEKSCSVFHKTFVPTTREATNIENPNNVEFSCAQRCRKAAMVQQLLHKMNADNFDCDTKKQRLLKKCKQGCDSADFACVEKNLFANFALPVLFVRRSAMHRETCVWDDHVFKVKCEAVSEPDIRQLFDIKMLTLHEFIQLTMAPLERYANIYVDPLPSTLNANTVLDESLPAFPGHSDNNDATTTQTQKKTKNAKKRKEKHDSAVKLAQGRQKKFAQLAEQFVDKYEERANCVRGPLANTSEWNKTARQALANELERTHKIQAILTESDRVWEQRHLSGEEQERLYRDHVKQCKLLAEDTRNNVHNVFSEEKIEVYDAHFERQKANVQFVYKPMQTRTDLTQNDHTRQDYESACNDFLPLSANIDRDEFVNFCNDDGAFVLAENMNSKSDFYSSSNNVAVKEKQKATKIQQSQTKTLSNSFTDKKIAVNQLDKHNLFLLYIAFCLKTKQKINGDILESCAKMHEDFLLKQIVTSYDAKNNSEVASVPNFRSWACDMQFRLLNWLQTIVAFLQNFKLTKNRQENVRKINQYQKMFPWLFANLNRDKLAARKTSEFSPGTNKSCYEDCLETPTLLQGDNADNSHLWSYLLKKNAASYHAQSWSQIDAAAYYNAHISAVAGNRTKVTWWTNAQWLVENRICKNTTLKNDSIVNCLKARRAQRKSRTSLFNNHTLLSICAETLGCGSPPFTEPRQNDGLERDARFAASKCRVIENNPNVHLTSMIWQALAKDWSEKDHLQHPHVLPLVRKIKSSLANTSQLAHQILKHAQVNWQDERNAMLNLWRDEFCDAHNVEKRFLHSSIFNDEHNLAVSSARQTVRRFLFCNGDYAHVPKKPFESLIRPYMLLDTWIRLVRDQPTTFSGKKRKKTAEPSGLESNNNCDTNSKKSGNDQSINTKNGTTKIDQDEKEKNKLKIANSKIDSTKSDTLTVHNKTTAKNNKSPSKSSLFQQVVATAKAQVVSSKNIADTPRAKRRCTRQKQK